MTSYMLDSNVLIDIAREPDGPVASNFGRWSREDIGISVIVAGEIRHGMRKNPQARSNPYMTYLLEGLAIEKLEPATDNLYGAVRRELEMQRKTISPNDYWIVAHAMAKDAILVTGDRGIYDAGLKGLRLEDWRA